jgi:hypothetical protein
MLVISKPFVLAQIWKPIWKAQGLIRISYAICSDPSPIFYERRVLKHADASKIIHIVSLKRSLSWMCLWTIFRMTFSKSLPVVDKRIIVRKFLGNIESLPGFGKVMTFAVLDLPPRLPLVAEMVSLRLANGCAACLMESERACRRGGATRQCCLSTLILLFPYNYYMRKYYIYNKLLE